jgi:hypothetical protein
MDACGMAMFPSFNSQWMTIHPDKCYSENEHFNEKNLSDAGDLEEKEKILVSPSVP